MFRAWLSIVLAAFVVVIPPSLSAQRYSFQYYGPEQGLTNLTVQCMLQDRTGFLWTGTQNGLFRYDGSQFVRYGVEDGLPSPSVQSLHETGDGALWVGTSVGLARRIDTNVDRGRFEHVVMKTPVEAIRQNAITSDSQRRLYVGTGRGLFVGIPGVGGTYGFQVYEPPSPQTSISGIHVDAADKVWLWCGSQICQFQSGAVVPFGKDLKVVPNRASSIVTGPDGKLWVRSAENLFVLEKGSVAFQARDDGLPNSNLFTSIYIDRDGVVLVPTDLGLARWVNNRWDLIGKQKGFASDLITTVFQDREGSIWVGVGGFGLARWKGYPQWESWTEADGLGNGNIWAITRDTRGTLWVGNDVGLHYLKTGGLKTGGLKTGGLKTGGLQPGEAGAVPVWQTWKLGRKSQTIDHILPAGDGTLWVGSSGGLLAHVNPAAGTTTVFEADSGLTNNHVFHSSFDGSGRLWVATRAGLFLGTGSKGRIRFEPAEPPGYKRSGAFDRFLLDRKGSLWIGGRGSLLRLTGRKWDQFTTKDGLPPQRLDRFAETGDGDLWVGFVGAGGVAKITFGGNGIHVQDVTPRPGSRPTLAIALGTDMGGRLWHTSDDGVDLLDGNTWRHYGSADGLIWDDCNGNAFFGDTDGSVWIGTSMGLSHFRPSKVELAQAPQAVITSYLLGDTQQNLKESRPVPYAARTFLANFSALTFLNEPAVRFRYRLKGLEKNWTEARVREARYPNLPSGAYTFEVLARNAAGVWSATPASVSFTILPAWWQSWIFWVACLIAFLSAVSMIWMWRFRHILEIQRALEIAVEQRTGEMLRAQAKVLEEKKNVEDQKVEIERLLHESQRAMQFKSQFLANMSHEIRTPMNGIIGLTELTLETELNPEQRSNLGLVRSSAASLLSVINDILDFSKVEAGKLDLEHIDFHLRGQLNDVIAMLTYRAREKNLQLICKIDGGVPDALVGDPGRLRQILINLLGNAMKFTDKGEVVLQVTEAKFVPAQQSGETALLHFEVRDTGIGIAKEHQSFILEPFRQADGSVTRKYGGTGLGLSISTQLAGLMNGTMWFESEQGKGSTFHFTAAFGRSTVAPHVPLASARAPETILSRDTVNAGHHTSGGGELMLAVSRSMRILVAEDNPVNQKLMITLLQRKGHLVTMAASGKQAVAISETQQFDLVLMDMQMPEMDGFEATSLIREREKGTDRRLRIIAITASAMVGDRERCLAAGLDDYVPKPINAADLYRVINYAPPAQPPSLSSVADAEGTAAPGDASV